MSDTMTTPAGHRTLHDWFAASAAAHGPLPALEAAGRVVSYAELDALAGRIAAALLEHLGGRAPAGWACSPGARSSRTPGTSPSSVWAPPWCRSARPSRTPGTSPWPAPPPWTPYSPTNTPRPASPCPLPCCG